MCFAWDRAQRVGDVFAFPLLLGKSNEGHACFASSNIALIVLEGETVAQMR